MIQNEYDGPPPEFSFNEFFAGCGLAWTGLGPSWDCRLANDFDWTKKLAYELNHDFHHFKFGDIAKLAADDIPQVNCWWASPPCQDVSLAGAGAGLGGACSGAFWPFVNLLRVMGPRAPNLVVVENVEGLVSGRDGADFVTVLETLMALGYRVGASIIDACFFVPQSRPRVFIIAVRKDLAIPASLIGGGPTAWCTPATLARVVGRMPRALKADWFWPYLPEPPARTLALADCLYPEADAGYRDAAGELPRFSSASLKIVEKANASGERKVCPAYLRTRDGKPQWELRDDGLIGAIRTAEGGSSLQSLFEIETKSIRRRLMTGREAAYAMGAPPGFRLLSLKDDKNAAITAIGDAVCPPAVRFLAANALEPILRGHRLDREDLRRAAE
jgi:DNA (cytosine-5)-methyltransferase 1